MLQQSNFEQMQTTVTPDLEGFEDLLVDESLKNNLPAAGTRNADETTSRGSNNVAPNINSIHGEFSNNCSLGNGPQKSDSFNLTEIAEKMANDGLGEVDSCGSETSLVSVGGYKVKHKNGSLVGYILSKYGDIGANCCLETVRFRSLYMDVLCEIIQKLKNTNIVAITEDDLEEMMGCVVDIETANINIGWLKERLIEIQEAKQILSPSSKEKNHHAELKARVKKRSQELEDYKRELAIKETQLQHLGKEIFAIERDIVAIEDGVAKVEKVTSENKAKLRPFVKLGSLSQGLI